MMKKICEFCKKNKFILFIIVFIIICIVCLLQLNNDLKVISLEDKNYRLEYDSRWKVKEKENDYIILNHKPSKSTLKIEIIKLYNEHQYDSIESLVDEIIYNIHEQNENYKLISKLDGFFTKYGYSGYKMLYENDEEQVMVITFKKDDKLVVAIYESKHKYFDILLDSVQNIIYNFNIIDETFDIQNNLEIETTKIKYGTSKELEELLNDSKTYQISNSNYRVVYSIPSIFKLSNLDTTFNSFDLTNVDNGKIWINLQIYNKNVYEYLDKNNVNNIYKNYNSCREEENFEEQISELNVKYKDSYIYKNSYKIDSVRYNDKYEQEHYKKAMENIELIYSLNKNHVLVVTIKASDISIPQKLIELINIDSITNYSGYTDSIVEDGYRYVELKRYKDNEKNKTENIIIKIPDSYKEYDKGNNLYEERYFNLNYNEDTELYDYVIHYNLTSNIIKDISKEIDILNMSFSKSYGQFNYYNQSQEILINGKKFIEYNGGYTKLGGIMFTDIDRYEYYINKKALFYELDNGGFLIIEISGNGKEINNEIINQVTNFEIKEKNVE